MKSEERARLRAMKAEVARQERELQKVLGANEVETSLTAADRVVAEAAKAHEDERAAIVKWLRIFEDLATLADRIERAAHLEDEHGQ